MRRLVDPALALGAALAILVALVALRGMSDGVTTERVAVEGTPATIFRPVGGAPAPAVVIAHGFAGSQQLMQAFATTLARNGYVAVTFDYAGHGRNPRPLPGNITREDGATRSLVAETASIAAFARPLGDGRLAVLGHSMASDIVVRVAQADPAVAATVAVSMFSPAVTASAPRNLLVVVGEWEGALKREALRAVGLVSAPAEPLPGVTYRDAAGNARRAAFSPHVEHVAVLYSTTSSREALQWLDGVFGRTTPGEPFLDGRGPWILLLLAGIVLAARPLATLLPVVSRPPAGAGLGWRRVWPSVVLPAIVTPLVLRVMPTHFLPVLVADYLAAHFALYGILTAGCVWAARRRMPERARPIVSASRLLAAALAATAFGFFGIVWAVDTHVTSFVPGPGRPTLLCALLAGTMFYVLADEWLTRGADAARGAYLASKIAFLVSLGMAVALDFERLFFLVIIVPVIGPFFLVYGLLSRWVYDRTGHPFVAGIANAVAFAWALAVTFPLLAA